MRRSVPALLTLLLAAAACFPQTPTGSTATAAAASTTGASASTTGSGSGGADAGTPCDGKKVCAECTACASNQLCADVLTTCNQNPACVGIDQCVQICGVDSDCKQQCYIGNPDGTTDYQAVLTCLYCTQCPSDCAGYVKCN
jgi:hypothetical protein